MKTPNRHLIAFITFMVLIPLVYFVPEIIATYITDNKLANVILSVAVIVTALSYLIMPVCIKLIKRVSITK